MSKTLTIGIAPLDYLKRRTIEIASGRRRHAGEPKAWATSAESVARTLSPENLALLDLIRKAKPQSVAELATLSGRAKSNLSRTLHSLAMLGVIELRESEGGRKVPVAPYGRVLVDMTAARELA